MVREKLPVPVECFLHTSPPSVSRSPRHLEIALLCLMEDNHLDEHESGEAEDTSTVQEKVPDEVVGRRLSLKDISDGRRPSLSDRRDSDTLSESEEEYLRKMLQERRGSFRPQPKQTVAYEVQSSDTLEGIAIRYNITPSELTVLNKLNSRVVFPGQTIYIPEKNSLQNLEELLKQSAAALAASAAEQSSPKPGHVERVPRDDGSASVSDFTETLVAEFDEKRIQSGAKESLRVNSKYVTDGEGVVGGVLIVTTNHIIFDPNVSDPLVIEYGMDKYGVDAPMAYIVRGALYTDIFRMRTKDAVHMSTCDTKVNVYHSKNLNMKKSRSQGEKLGKPDKLKQGRRFSAFETGTKRHDVLMPFSNSFQENLSKICESADPEEECKETISEDGNSISRLPVNSDKEVGRNFLSRKKPLSASSSFDSEDGLPSRKSSITDDDAMILSPDSGSPKKKSSFEKTKRKLGKSLRKLSITDGLFSSTAGGGGGRRLSLPAFASLPDFKLKSSDKGSEKTVDDENPENKSGCAIYVNMVDEKPELFAPLDKLIPRPAKSFCDTPLYLCLRMGMPVEKPPISTNSVIHFGHKMRPEYWFSIPKDSVDDLYFFFLRWCPEKYGDIDKIDMTELGYNSIETEDEDEEVLEEKVAHNYRRASWAFPWRRKSKDVTETSNTSSPEACDWEVLDYMGHKADVIHPPELLTPSKILNDDQLLEINKHLPARAMNPWALIYGTTDCGFSLKTMYRAMTKYDSPVLIVVANRSNAIFGALLSSPLRLSDHFYGTGESFLFTFYPEFKVFNWSGQNDYFIKGNTDSFIVGSSEGHFGLWLDDDLFRGRTNSCQTFASDPLCPEEDFEVKSLEAWAFV